VRELAVGRVRVVGVGSGSGDDAAGLLAVRAVRAELTGLGVEVAEVGAGARLVDLLQDADVVIVVDAVRGTGLAPGEIVRVEAGPAGLAAEVGTSLSSHGLGVAEAVALASALPAPPRIVVIGVQAAETRAGAPLSDPVAAAVPRVGARVLAEVRAVSGH
jgi:hydrogenase maturation protease